MNDDEDEVEEVVWTTETTAHPYALLATKTLSGPAAEREEERERERKRERKGERKGERGREREEGRERK